MFSISTHQSNHQNKNDLTQYPVYGYYGSEVQPPTYPSSTHSQLCSAYINQRVVQAIVGILTAGLVRKSQDLTRSPSVELISMYL